MTDLPEIVARYQRSGSLEQLEEYIADREAVAYKAGYLEGERQGGTMPVCIDPSKHTARTTTYRIRRSRSEVV